MIKKIKNFFLAFKKLNKKEVILACLKDKRNLCFGAFLFFLLLSLVLPTRVQAWDPLGDLFNAIVSGMIKVAGIILFIVPLFISWVFVMIAGLILGWVISTNFINIPFTTNEFVIAGLSITRGFANMAFILFLVVIALANALRIEEYKAKKTLPTLIIIALLINFSPVFCGLIIDATNVVMFTFLDNLTGIEGFFSTLERTTTAVWKLIAEGWGDPRASAWSFFMAIAVIVFNFFAAFMFMVFSALFTVRYVMLWILIILSPIAFVSYILPITRRGRSLLNWKTWWEQLTQWSIIGIIAAFFLYLAFLMIGVMQKIQVLKPGPEGLGLANEILPFLVPIILLWIGWKEAKKTSAMLARGIMEAPEKIAKAGAQAAIMAGVAVATAGAGAAAAAASGKIGLAAGKLGGYAAAHPGTITGRLAGGGSKILGAAAKPKEWAKRRKAAVKERVEEFAEKHSKFAAAGRGLKAAFSEHAVEEKGEKLTDDQLKSGYTEGRKFTDWEKKTGWKQGKPLTGEEIKSGYSEGRKLTKEEKKQKYLKDRDLTEDEKKSGYLQEGKKLTEKEMKMGVKLRIVLKPAVIIPAKEMIIEPMIKPVKEGIKAALEATKKEYARILSAKLKTRLQAELEGLRDKLDIGEEPTDEDFEKLRKTGEKLKGKWERERDIGELKAEVNRLIEKEEEKRMPRIKPKPPEEKKPPGEKKPPEEKKKEPRGWAGPGKREK